MTPVIPSTARDLLAEQQILRADDQDNGPQDDPRVIPIRRLLQRRRETGSIGPLPRGRGPQPKISGRRLEKLRALVEQHPDATLDELRRRLRLKCANSTVYLALLRLGLSYKKSRSTPRSSSGPTSNKRAAAGAAARNI